MANPMHQNDVDRALHDLAHHLPAQAPLKDFVHHNTLHAFQHLPFHLGLKSAADSFGYKVYLPLNHYRNLFFTKKINTLILDKTILQNKQPETMASWKQKMLYGEYQEGRTLLIGQTRKFWKEKYRVNLDKETHPLLFRLLSSYLDQGISIWKMPLPAKGLLWAVRNMESNSFTSIFDSKRARQLLLNPKTKLEDLLGILVGDPKAYRAYIYDQQFAHPGWSGMVAVLEQQPVSLLDKKSVTLKELVTLECLLEIDALDRRLGQNWKPIFDGRPANTPDITALQPLTELDEVLKLWQEAFEWSYYDQVVKGLQYPATTPPTSKQTPLQAIFCIDDRCCSIRRYLERFIPGAETFGTAGFFNLPFYFQPEHGKFLTKVCPAPVTPSHVIRETEANIRHQKDTHFSKHAHGVFGAWAISQTMGFWSAVKMAKNIFRPGPTPAMVSSFRHMDPKGKLSIVCKNPENRYQGLQVGFTIAEMADSFEGLLSSIGLVDNFAKLIYIFGHGASSVNNTHYASYDCGACSGRAGSVNARVAAHIGNNNEVRKLLRTRGIDIPDSCRFIGGLHDTTQDEMEFYDLDYIPASLQKLHASHLPKFEKVLQYNAKERSRRFDNVDSTAPAEKVHKKVKLRSLSLFEPRPEWNHATNALCIVGNRLNNKHLFLDKRAFLNSYDHSIDPEGKYLFGILKAVAPVCGGINLEYYFSRMDNEKLGAGTKLPHNVIGLIGVANGMEGDLRPGLPKQMINIHDPLRILITVEHLPEIVLKAIKIHEPTYEWFENEWVRLVVIHPETKEAYLFQEGAFVPYHPVSESPERIADLDDKLVSTSANLPVYLIS
jgi:uncharacterized protein